MDKGSFKMITKLTQDTIPPFKFSATQKQFTNFINSGGFKETERFVNQVQTKKTNTRRWPLEMWDYFIWTWIWSSCLTAWQPWNLTLFELKRNRVFKWGSINILTTLGLLIKRPTKYLVLLSSKVNFFLLPWGMIFDMRLYSQYPCLVHEQGVSASLGNGSSQIPYPIKDGHWVVDWLVLLLR